MVVGQYCRLCPRLAGYRDELRQRFPSYHNGPVDAFGADDADLLIVGLAPGLHGANKTGKPFTGDASGDMLFETLHRFGFASQRSSREFNESMRLTDCRITNAVKCVPPENRPSPAELNTCNRYLIDELAVARVILVLGGEALRAVALALGLPKSAYAFVHGAEYETPAGQQMLVSYHPSLRNTNTGKLTVAMFDRLFDRLVELVR